MPTHGIDLQAVGGGTVRWFAGSNIARGGHGRRLIVKLATFTHGGRTRVGLVDGSDIVDLAAAVPALPQEMCAFLRAGRPALEAARNALAQHTARLPRNDVWLEAPVQRPGKLITIGINYREHAAEAGR